jgi:thymidylate synthase (FAD)
VSFAQQAQRVVDMSNFDTRLPETVKDAGKEGLWKLCMMQIGSTYKMLRDIGVPAQDARGVLPTNVYTNILARFDLRALADMLGKRDNLRAQDEYSEVAKMIKTELYAVHPWARMFVEPERIRTPALDKILADLLGNRSPVDVPEINAALKEKDALKAIWG